MAGVAGRFPGRYDSPIAAKLSGCHVNQDDDPWWLVGALGWVALYDNIAQAQGKVGDNFRPQLEEKLRREPPGFLYKYHRRFVQCCEAEAARRDA